MRQIIISIFILLYCIIGVYNLIVGNSLIYRLKRNKNYKENEKHPMRDYLSKNDFTIMRGIKDKWYYFL